MCTAKMLYALIGALQHIKNSDNPASASYLPRDNSIQRCIAPAASDLNALVYNRVRDSTAHDDAHAPPRRLYRSAHNPDAQLRGESRYTFTKSSICS